MSDLDAIADALSTLPAGSPFRELIPLYASPDDATRREGSALLVKLGLRGLHRPPPQDEATALGILRAVRLLPDPPEPPRVSDLVRTLLGTAHPSLVGPIRELYDAASDPLRLSFLTLLAVQGTADGARALVVLVEAHGWPGLSPQLRDELVRFDLPHGSILFPRLLELDGWERPELQAVLVEMLDHGSVMPADIAHTTLARTLPQRIDELVVARVSERVDRDYVDRILALQLDLAGWVGPPEVLPKLRSCAGSSSEHVARYAREALQRRGASVLVE
ncbi:MAG: hypothetical protein JJ863_07460 [Deltaproteobacteria bacterium]|nr:hypothetical protein [Deltaproteobacteria bacterium]